MPQTRIVEMQNVTKTFGTAAAVDGISFDIHAGECVALLGPSGCGKTTTLRLLAGFQQPSSGAIIMEGRDVLRLRPYERNVGLVFQDYALFPHFTVAQNIEYGMRRRGLPRADIEARRKGLIDLVRLGGLEERRPSEISGGQQQRVAIARALAPRPALLLLDEPLSNLDTGLRLALRQNLREILSATGATTLLVTHDQEEAMAMADRIVVLDKGRVQQAGPPREIYRRPVNRFVAEFMGPSLFLPAEVTADTGAASVTAKLSDGTLLKAVLRSKRLMPRTGLGVMIRPERIDICFPDAPMPQAANRLAATVVARDFLGAVEEVTLRLQTGDVVHVRQPARDSETGSGASVALDIPHEACLLIPEHSS